MSMQKNEKKETQSIAAETVEQYLRSHPEFFQGRDELLREISVPHPAGGAISLVERQVALLREQNRRYRRQLQDLVDIARSNDELLEHLQALTLRIIGGNGLRHTLTVLEDSLRTDFQADAASLQLFTETEVSLDRPGEHFLRVSRIPPDDVSGDLRRLLAGGMPVCGRFGDDRLGELFGPQAAPIGSTALLPLSGGDGGRILGVLAIGSQDEERFSSGMGTTYLRHLAELIGHRIAPLVPEPLPAVPA